MLFSDLAGHLIAHYRVTAKLGEGGMGEVWRATDTKLGREVALKLLPAAFTADAERLARFEREAKLLAQLNHPNIAQIYGLEASADRRALVMELVEGPTLADRLSQGALSVEESLAIARRIAEALEEAHEKGIVHRDLKPQNVKASAEGRVKVLDFGLAKAMEPAPGSAAAAELANSPTVTGAHTHQGVILGTAAYMAPEQARGAPTDRRVDIWAFGVVLHEMLTGERLFAEGSVVDTLSAVMRKAVDFDRLPASTPPAVRRLLHHCLERNPRNRLRDIGDARLALEEAERGASETSEPASAGAATRASGRRGRALPWAVAAVAALAAAIAIPLAFRGGGESAAAERPLTAFGILYPAGASPPRTQSPLLDLSADGRTLYFVAEDERSFSLYRRSFDRLEVSRIGGTEGAEDPVLSPDGRSIAFFAGGRLKKIDAEGGTAVTLAEARTPRGATWSPDGSLIFSPVYNSGLFRVPATGGEAVALTRLDESKGERSHRWPQALPDGRAVIFTVGLVTKASDYDDCAIDAVRLDTGERRTILSGARMARFSAAGYLVYQRRQALFGVRFDPARLERIGEPFVIREGVGGDTGGGAGFFAVSAGGALAYLPESSIPKERGLVLADREGRATDLAIPPARFTGPRFSPAGDRVAFSIGSGGLADDDVYVLELGTNRMARLTFESGRAFVAWSPDGRRVVYTRRKDGGQTLVTKSADGGGGEVEIPNEAGFAMTSAWLADGRLVVSDIERSIDVVVVDPRTGATTPLFASPTAAEYEAAVSPDGRFIAYTSTESAVDEVFVESFPPGAGRWQISVSGGACPVWSRDGTELYFASGSTIMAAAVETRGVFRSATPRALFDGPYELCAPPLRQYDVGPDGRFVLVRRRIVSTVPRELVVLDGWPAADPARTAAR